MPVRRERSMQLEELPIDSEVLSLLVNMCERQDSPKGKCKDFTENDDVGVEGAIALSQISRGSLLWDSKPREKSIFRVSKWGL